MIRFLLHPSMFASLSATAKERWKHEHHKKRWERRYGKSYVSVTGEVYSHGGFVIREGS